MHLLSRLLFVIIICCFAFVGHSQPPTWKTFHYGQVSLRYPPNWQANKISRGGRTLATLTPDSMRNLTMRMIRISELPVSGDHNYATFKKVFAAILKSGVDANKILKTEEISFKGHKAMYAEMVENSLPEKVYGINAGKNIYIIALLQRRYSNIPDPKMEKDEMAILDTITFD